MNSVPQTIWQQVNELELVRINLEGWFNNAMDRLSGWYKRRSLGVTLVAGLLLSFIFNVDSLNLVTRMWQEPDLRLAIIEKVEAILTKDTSVLAEAQVLELEQNITNINLPIGWLGSPIDFNELAIEEPARDKGFTFEAGLVDLILRDAGIKDDAPMSGIPPEPGALPLLSPPPGEVCVCAEACITRA